MKAISQPENLFHVSPLENGTAEQNAKSWNSLWNRTETDPLKVLALRIIQRNSQWNTIGKGSETGGTKGGTDMKSAVPAFDPEAFAERAALIEVNGIPRDWAEGFAKLCVMPFPAAYTPQRWEQIVNDGGLFLDGWGKQAAALGWRAVDVFGVNPDAPELRYDGMGLAVLLEGRRVVAITAHTGRIECGQENFLTYRHCQSLSQSQLLWSLAP